MVSARLAHPCRQCGAGTGEECTPAGVYHDVRFPPYRELLQRAHKVAELVAATPPEVDPDLLERGGAGDDDAARTFRFDYSRSAGLKNTASRVTWGEFVTAIRNRKRGSR